MNIFAPPKPRAKSGPNAATPPRVPSFEEVRLTTQKAPDRDATTGPTAGFDWGFTLKPMTMAEIAAQPDAEWESAPATGLPTDPAALIRHAWDMAIAPLRTLLTDPLPRTDWQDCLLGIEGSAYRELSQLSAALVAHTNKALDLVTAGAEETGTEAAR